MPVYYIADGSREASRRLGAADFVAPAATAGAVWLVSYRAGAVMPATAGTEQEFSVSGAALGPRRRLPRGQGESEENDLDRVPAPPSAGAAQPPAGRASSKLWVPGR
jgi:hypothetical protein